MNIPCRECDREYDIPVTNEQLLRHYNHEALAQVIWPDITAPLRELLISGICPVCWEEMFASMEEEE